MSGVPFAIRPNRQLEEIKREYPGIIAYIDYLEDLDKITSERARVAEQWLKQKKCQHYFVHNSMCVECGKEGVS